MIPPRRTRLRGLSRVFPKGITVQTAQLRALSGSTPCEVNEKSDQPKPVALTCFGGPSGGRTLDLGIKSLKRDVLARAASAKLLVPMLSPAPHALKLHWRTVINGYAAMHKTPSRHYREGVRAYGLSIIT